MRQFSKTTFVALGIVAVMFAAPIAWAHGGGSWGHGHGRDGGGGVPEIDPGMASSAIAPLSCGGLILTSKAGRKK